MASFLTVRDQDEGCAQAGGCAGRFKLRLHGKPQILVQRNPEASSEQKARPASVTKARAQSHAVLLSHPPLS